MFSTHFGRIHKSADNSFVTKQYGLNLDSILLLHNIGNWGNVQGFQSNEYHNRSLQLQRKRLKVKRHTLPDIALTLFHMGGGVSPPQPNFSTLRRNDTRYDDQTL